MKRLETLETKRITPACAGKTIDVNALNLRHPDHPRMRGEDTTTLRGFAVQRGSPPHARGRLPDVLQRQDGSGITPACAGKTCRRRLRRRRQEDHPRMRGEDQGGI